MNKLHNRIFKIFIKNYYNSLININTFKVQYNQSTKNWESFYVVN